MKAKNIFFSILLGAVISSDVFALHDNSSACGKGHEGWKQDCSGRPNVGAPMNDMGSGYSGIIIGAVFFMVKRLMTAKGGGK